MEGGGLGRHLGRGINRNPNAITEAEIRNHIAGVIDDMIIHLEAEDEEEEEEKTKRVIKRYKQSDEMGEDRVKDPDELEAMRAALGDLY